MHHSVRWDELPVSRADAMSKKFAEYLTFRPNWSSPHIHDYLHGYRKCADQVAMIDNQGMHVQAHVMGAMGFVSKTVPQLNVLSLGFPIRILVGLVVIIASLPILMSVSDAFTADVLDALQRRHWIKRAGFPWIRPTRLRDDPEANRLFLEMLTSSKDPGVLGFYGFRNRADHSYERMSIASAKMIQVDRVWDVLSQAGKQVVVHGVPQTYPVKPVNGFMISGWMTPYTARDYVYPPELGDELRQELGDYRIYPTTTCTVGHERHYLEASIQLLEMRTHTASGSTAPSAAPQPPAPKPRNVILLIVDAMRAEIEAAIDFPEDIEAAEAVRRLAKGIEGEQLTRKGDTLGCGCVPQQCLVHVGAHARERPHGPRGDRETAIASSAPPHTAFPWDAHTKKESRFACGAPA